MTISVKFPFKETQRGGVFQATTTTQESIQTNLVSLLTTKRRHRVMRSGLYSPLWDYIFEPWDDISAETLKTELIDKISEYIPEVIVSDIIFTFTEQESLLEVKVKYRIIDLGDINEEVVVSIPVEPGNQ